MTRLSPERIAELRKASTNYECNDPAGYCPTREGLWMTIGELLDAYESLAAEADRYRVALEQIRGMPKESIWSDDRDDAADMIVDIARRALAGEKP